MSGIASIAKKAGATLASAFAVKKVFDFGKECIKLGSDLTEVQNVVDVTFPHMAKQVDEFAKSAATAFGLSETMAKKFTGTFGAMAKAFGFSEKAAYDMSTTLTGLAGDVASFYNIAQDEAYTKLKSVFSGETETLKDLGIVMTQNALDAYAMANGYGKAISKMSEMEKVSLRYAFIQDKLALATGDFARTSDQWANQVRILSLNFDTLKATIGQGLINIFLPIVKVINIVIGKLTTLANAFKAFTELLTGKKAQSGGGIKDTAAAASAASDGLGSATGAADKLGKATDKAGKKAKKAAKDMKQLSSIDSKLNILNDSKSGSGGDGGGKGSGSGAGGGGASGSDVDFGKLAEGDNPVDKINSKLKALVERLKELAALFKKGFEIGIGDLSVLDSIKSNVESIGKSFKSIFTDPAVMDAANRFLDSLALNTGKVAGSLASVGLTIADNLTGGMARYLSQNTGRIKQYIINMFDISSDIGDITGDLSTALADIFTVFRGDSAKQITADIIAVFSNGFMGVTEVAAKLGRDILDCIADPIIENKDKIKETISELFKGIEPIFKSLSDLVTNTFKKINEVYDTYIEPAWEKISSGIKKILSMALDAFNKYLLPVIKRIGKEFKNLMDKHIQPLIDSFLELCGKVIEALGKLWDFISPFVGLIVEKCIVKIATKLEFLWNKVKLVISVLADLAKGFFDSLSGLIDFITGVFTGDWQKAWDGIKKIYSSFWNAIKKTVKDAITFVKDTISTGFNAVKSTIEVIWHKICTYLSTVWRQIKTIFAPVGDYIAGKFKDAVDGIKKVFGTIGKWFSDRCKEIKTAFSDIGKWFSNKFKSAYDAITKIFKGIGTWFGDRYKDIKSVFSGVVAFFKGKFADAWSAIKNVFSTAKLKSFFGGVWNTIKGVFTSIGTKVGTAVGGAFKSAMRSALKTVEDAVNSGIDLINGALGILKKIPQIGKNIGTIKHVKFSALAQGGYVKANTPQLAMIGDNRHQGEVVAPENKLKEMAMEAARAVQGNNSSAEEVALLRQMVSLLGKIYDKDPVGMTTRELFNIVKSENDSYRKRTGSPAFI